MKNSNYMLDRSFRSKDAKRKTKATTYPLEIVSPVSISDSSVGTVVDWLKSKLLTNRMCLDLLESTLPILARPLSSPTNDDLISTLLSSSTPNSSSENFDKSNKISGLTFRCETRWLGAWSSDDNTFSDVDFDKIGSPSWLVAPLSMEIFDNIADSGEWVFLKRVWLFCMRACASVTTIAVSIQEIQVIFK